MEVRLAGLNVLHAVVCDYLFIYLFSWLLPPREWRRRQHKRRHGSKRLCHCRLKATDGCCVYCCKRRRSCSVLVDVFSTSSAPSSRSSLGSSLNLSTSILFLLTFFLRGVVREWPESPGRFALLSFVCLKSVRNSVLLLGDEIIDTMLFTGEQTFDKCQFISVEFSLASTWWDTRKTYPEIPESPRWNHQVCRKKYVVSPASVPLIEAYPNSQDWKCSSRPVSWKFLSSNCLNFSHCNLAPSWYNILWHPSVYPWYHLWLPRLMLLRTF